MYKFIFLLVVAIFSGCSTFTNNAEPINLKFKISQLNVIETEKKWINNNKPIETPFFTTKISKDLNITTAGFFTMEKDDSFFKGIVNILIINNNYFFDKFVIKNCENGSYKFRNGILLQKDNLKNSFRLAIIKNRYFCITINKDNKSYMEIKNAYK